jgi:hypothetical protein
MTTSQLSALRVVGAVTITPATPGDLHAILDLVDACRRPRVAFLPYVW